ncbi:Gfo/Idh/MocA family protein [Jiangella asiatica]|uniref:Gfo/Idh/MocA family oxidoreductase n=1 Tax=Jiangella asiatica TaxID=2530372 RepID=A0A4R5DU81_9ACTN|nr:Gfo/Idh/MocA family oxidoreductase [Jiangella asiatica]TDE16014.1 Gfo/Idh/MocA family oxidoreductase [Jiangella asiatica]
MLDVLRPIAAACDLSVPAGHRLPISVVGAGSIVDVAHLPAYAAAGLEVRGIFDLDGAKAAAVAERHGVERLYGSLDELLADDVPVVDIAVAPAAQPDIARRALEAGKHLLCQKPFALELSVAEDLVALAADRGRAVTVNQQMRYEEGVAAAREMVRQGWIGEPTSMTITVDIATDFSGWPWLYRSPRLDFWYHSIHYFDSVRSVLGDPATVYAATGGTPGQGPAGETRTVSTLTFPSGAHAMVFVNHENRAGDAVAQFRIDGSEGAVRGTIGLLYDYPRGRPGTVEVSSRTLPTDGWLTYPVTSRWLPDAVAGPMRALLAEVATGAEAPTSARDNLGTLRLIHALYRSADTGQVQAP